MKMNLDASAIEYIQRVVKTAQMVNIDNIIIERGAVRAIDDNKTVVLYQNEDVPDMPFGSIGLNRISDFTSRLNVVATQDSSNMVADVDDDSEYVRMLTMKANGLKIDYRCANPTTIQAPKQINDVLMYRVALNASAVSLLQQGQSAMNAENVSINSGTGGVSFDIVDINNDRFEHTFTTDVESLSDESDETLFAHSYPIKILLPLFKHNPDGYFDIGKKGILSISVNGLTIFVLPRV